MHLSNIDSNNDNRLKFDVIGKEHKYHCVFKLNFLHNKYLFHEYMIILCLNIWLKII